jgi:dihydrofolate synthase/folylpolyglutamate synthase
MRGYDGALQYLFGLERFGTVLGLENVRSILALFGDPQVSLPVIHVAGTNGKGSVSAMASAILKGAGYCVGTYTSPHLISFTERITINATPLSEDAVAALAERMRVAIEATGRGRFFTFFDFTTAMALLCFREQNVDAAVMEVGMGGRLDSTNVVDPAVTIVTNVSRDHTDYLGNSIQAIASEKAGIMKPGIPVVTATTGEALDVIERRAEELACPVYRPARGFRFKKLGEQRMAYDGPRFRLPELFVNLAGDHQLTNAAVALCAAEVFSQGRRPLDPEKTSKALREVVWPGRLEIVRRTPSILLDGAHNVDGMRSLGSYLRDYYGTKQKILIFGAMKDKDYAAMLREISLSVDRIVVTAPAMDRAADPETLASLVDNPVIVPAVFEALRTAKSLAGGDDLIVVAGSLFLVAEVKRYIDEIF